MHMCVCVCVCVCVCGMCMYVCVCVFVCTYVGEDWRNKAVTLITNKSMWLAKVRVSY